MAKSVDVLRWPKFGRKEIFRDIILLTGLTAVLLGDLRVTSVPPTELPSHPAYLKPTIRDGPETNCWDNLETK